MNNSEHKYERVYKVAVELFEGNEGRAKKWMKSPLRPLGWQSPLEVLDTPDGEEKVLTLIAQIEHSVYA